MPFPSSVRLVEVGPRDGLQNESRAVPLSSRVRLIERLASAGLKTIECGSFVSPRRVPQMSDTEAVLGQIRRLPDVSYTALVPNVMGLQRAMACQLKEAAVFVAASETFSQANINCSIEESLERAQKIVELAAKNGIRVRGYVSCVLGCPFEGEVSNAEVARVAERLAEMGCYEISLGDTIGKGTPVKAQEMLGAVAKQVSLKQLAVHFHDTWGQALANIFASLELGVAVIDSSVAGLGGCPYAPGATGNVATEDVVYMLEGMGFETGVDLKKLSEAGIAISQELGHASHSKAANAIAAAGLGKAR